MSTLPALGLRPTLACFRPAAAPVVRVELDPDHRLPDLNRDNNVWESNP